MSGSEPEPVLSRVRGPFRAVGEIVLPPGACPDEKGWLQVESIVEKALAERPAGARRQLRLFLRLVNFLPVPGTGRTLAKLQVHRREKILRGLERCPFSLLRRGLWAVRSLLFMGYYSQEAVRQAIGYRARAGGWTALRGMGSPGGRGAGEDPGSPDAGGLVDGPQSDSGEASS